jgi:AraC-like DNA-binding protein
VRAVRAGESGPELHAHFAIQLGISLQGEMSYRAGRSGRNQKAEGWLVGSDQQHWLRGDGVSAVFFLDPLTAVGQRAEAAVRIVGVLALPHELCAMARPELERCWRRGWRGNELQSLADRLVVQLSPQHACPRTLDPRVQTVIDALHSEVSENIRLEELAASVGLSESRLAHLFRHDVGIPMRQYRLTLRMEEAVAQIAMGRSMTESAHMAGFADAAHFCRICRRMFGSAPSQLPNFRIERDAVQKRISFSTR